MTFHVPIMCHGIPGSGSEESAESLCFRWVNTLLGNLKTAITATFHAIRRPYVPPYFAEFQYRFNRRADLVAMLDQLASAAARATPRPYRQKDTKSGPLVPWSKRVGRVCQAA